MRLQTKAVLFASLLLAVACAADGGDEGDEYPDVDADGEIGDLVAASDLTLTGNIAANSWKVHSFTVDGSPDLSVVLDWADARVNLNLFLYDPSGRLVASSNGTADKPEDVVAEQAASGTWKLGIKNKNTSRATSYTVVVSRTAPPVTAPSFPGHPRSGHVFWGSSIGGNGEPVTRHELPSGHPLGLHRTYYQWTQRTGSIVRTAADDHAHGRLPWVSIKTPSWDEMGAGLHDAEIDELLRGLDALGQPVWLTIHHEPEGGGESGNTPDDPAGPAGHLRMNRRVRARMTALGTKHIALAPILMTYTWKAGSGRNPEEWWAPGIYDFMGVDHYAHSETSLIDPAWIAIRAFAKAKGVEVAVGEWGMRGIDVAAGQRVKAWYDAAIASETDGSARVIGMSAFDSNLNSPDGGWELKGEQLKVFQQLLGDPRTESIRNLAP